MGRPRHAGRVIEPLREWAEAGRIRPLVAEAFPLERGADAHRLVGEGRNVGKVVLTVGADGCIGSSREPAPRGYAELVVTRASPIDGKRLP